MKRLIGDKFGGEVDCLFGIADEEKLLSHHQIRIGNTIVLYAISEAKVSYEVLQTESDIRDNRLGIACRSSTRTGKRN